MSGFINGIFRVITIVSPKRGSFLPCVTWMSGAGRKYVRLSPIIDERPHSTATFILICHANYLDLEMTARSDNRNYQSSKNKLRKKTLAQDKGVNNDCTDRQGCRSRRKEFHKFTTVKYSLVLSQLIQRSSLKLWLRSFFGTVSVSCPNCSLLSIICLNETNFICLRFIYFFIFHQSKSTLVISMSGTYLISFLLKILMFSFYTNHKWYWLFYTPAHSPKRFHKETRGDKFVSFRASKRITFPWK